MLAFKGTVTRLEQAEGRALRLGQTGSCRLGNFTFGKLSLG